MGTLLIIEDDTDLREGLVFLFQAEGYGVLGRAASGTGIGCSRPTL